MKSQSVNGQARLPAPVCVQGASPVRRTTKSAIDKFRPPSIVPVVRPRLWSAEDNPLMCH